MPHSPAITMPAGVRARRIPLRAESISALACSAVVIQYGPRSDNPFVREPQAARVFQMRRAITIGAPGLTASGGRGNERGWKKMDVGLAEVAGVTDPGAVGIDFIA